MFQSGSMAMSNRVAWDLFCPLTWLSITNAGLLRPFDPNSLIFHSFYSPETSTLLKRQSCLFFADRRNSRKSVEEKRWVEAPRIESNTYVKPNQPRLRRGEESGLSLSFGDPEFIKMRVSFRTTEGSGSQGLMLPTDSPRKASKMAPQVSPPPAISIPSFTIVGSPGLRRRHLFTSLRCPRRCWRGPASRSVRRVLTVVEMPAPGKCA